MTKYPLIEAAGLKVIEGSLRPKDYSHLPNGLAHADYIRADDLEAFLERAQVVYGLNNPVSSNPQDHLWTSIPTTVNKPTHTARLILIEEIRPQTLEDKIKRILDDHGMTDQKALEEIRDLVERGE